jgi:SAM-dependent methyltransferase
MDIKETEILGADAGSHWYYRSKAEAVERCLRGVAFDTVLDVGAGSGYFSRHLLAHSDAQAAYCVDPNYSHEWQESVAGKPLVFLRDTEAISANLVLLMDVMEHVDDDVALLREYARKSLPSASFLISVPAFQWLWSAHDDFLGHRRRYTLSHLENVVRAAGLEVVSGNYYYGAIFPIAAAVRLLRRGKAKGAPVTSDLRPHSPPVNSILFALCHGELAIMKRNRLFGLTVFCLARRRDGISGGSRSRPEDVT